MNNVYDVAKKMANNKINGMDWSAIIKRAIPYISKDIKEYVSKYVAEDMPEVAEEILMLDIDDIVATVIDFTEAEKTQTGLQTYVDFPQIQSIVDSIAAGVNNDPEKIDEVTEYFAFDNEEGINIMKQEIVAIVTRNIAEFC